jgi:hypothetical protein
LVVSNIGVVEEIAEHDELRLIQSEGAGFAEIHDCEGDHILNVPAEEVASVAAAFETFVALYRKGERDGERSGRFYAKAEMRKALGL